MKILSLDIGGSFTKWAIFEDNKISEINKFPTFPENKYKLKYLIESLELNIKEISKKSGGLKYVGISTFGTVDKNGLYIDSWVDNHIGWNINKWFKDKFNLVATVNKDGDCFLKGETFLKNIKSKNIFSLAIGTGVAGSIQYDGKILTGDKYNSAAFSDIQMGSKKLSDLVSSLWLIKNVKKEESETINIDKLFKGFNAGRKSKETLVIKEWYDNLSIGIANVLVILDIRTIILGGGIIQSKNFSTNYIRNKISEILITDHKNGIEIFKSNNGDKSQLFGAMMFIKEKII